MKLSIFHKLLIVTLIYFSFLPISVAAERNTINIHITENTSTTLTVILQSTDLTKSLIGISTNLHIPNNLSYTSYEPGQFFEQTKAKVTYLIATKKSDPHILVIGIASLGQISSAHSGTIVTLHFNKQKSDLATVALTLENSVASGVVEQKRVDYKDIAWVVDRSLAETGSSLMIAVIISVVLSLLVIIRHYLLEQGRKNHTNELKTKSE